MEASLRKAVSRVLLHLSVEDREDREDREVFSSILCILISKYERIDICIQRGLLMDRGKIIAIITGVISLLIAIAYLVIVQVLDFRGEMIPAPVSQLTNWTIVLGCSF